MRPFTTLLSFDEAIRAVLSAAVPTTRSEVIPIGEADGRVAAEDVVSAIDVPPFDRAAMDGYAVVAEDTTGARPDAPRRLTCVGRLFTGETPEVTIHSGECLEIA